MPNIRKHLRIAYAIQNAGSIDFRRDLGDTVPVKHTLRGLRRAGHEVVCLKLDGRSVIGIEDICKLDHVWQAPLGLSGTRPFTFFESGIRRLQREMHLPYFAFFDLHRFYEACLRSLPGFTLCHEHNGLFCAGAALACGRLGIPYILTFSSDPIFERAVVGHPLRGFQAMVAAWEAQFTYKVAKKIICVSEPAKRHLIESWQVDPEKIVVLPNGVDSELFKPIENKASIKSKFGLEHKPVIGFAGSFQPWHGLDILIESFAIVLRDFPTAKLLLIGDGRARPMVDGKIAELGLESAVIITGLVPQAQVPQWLAIADIAVVPYPKLAKELWFSPLKLYEYMAAGKAIVASSAGQIVEVIRNGENGLLVDPGDVGALAQVMIELLKDPAERQRLGSNARRQAIEQHSWDHYVNRLEKLYLAVL